MPLSEHEQRQFDAIERALYADDPKFAHKVRVTDPRVVGKRAFLAGLAVVVLGVGVLVAGPVFANWYIGLLGFLVMLAGATRAYTGFRRWTGVAVRGADRSAGFTRRGEDLRAGGPDGDVRQLQPRRRGRRTKRSGVSGRTGFRELMEGRWRRRMDEGY